MTIKDLIKKYLNDPGVSTIEGETLVIDNRNEKYPCVCILKGWFGVLISKNFADHLIISLIENSDEETGVEWNLVQGWFWASDIDNYQELLSYTKKWIEEKAIMREGFHYFT